MIHPTTTRYFGALAKTYRICTDYITLIISKVEYDFKLDTHGKPPYTSIFRLIGRSCSLSTVAIFLLQTVTRFYRSFYVFELVSIHYDVINTNARFRQANS